MNSVDLARSVERPWPHMQIVLATGYSEAAAEAGKDFTVLRKPYQVEDLDWRSRLSLRHAMSLLPPMFSPP